MPVAGHSANKKQPLPLGNIVAWFRTKMALATGILMVLAGTIHAQPVTNLPAFVSAVMQDSPVGYWRLNETNSTASGTLTAVDMTGNYNGVYGSASGDGIPGPDPASGFAGFESFNTAAEFTNGVANSFVTLPELNLNTNTVTLSAWIYPIGTPVDACGLVFCRPGADASGFDISTGGQLGYLELEFRPGAAFATMVICCAGDLAGQRHHLSLQYKRSPVRHQPRSQHGRGIQHHHVDRR
jgi:hypothetical protein